VSLKHESPSFETNRKRDVVVREKVEWYAKRWKGDHSDVFTDPIDAPVESWKSILPATLVVSGELEIFIDDIKEICEKFKKVLSSLVELIVERSGSH
jgi:acetyl esterase/lipase